MTITRAATTLSLDIGSGTQDAVLYIAGEHIENLPQLVLPSPARKLAATIRQLTVQKQPVYLTGSNMGGGFFRAVQEHMQAGLAMAAHPHAALALSDNPERLATMGIVLTEHCPQGYTRLQTSDFDPQFWKKLFEAASLPSPTYILAAVQDHGVHLGMGNREGRMRLWHDALSQYKDDGGLPPASLVYSQVPPALTRLTALQEAFGATQGAVADTGIAAILGALCQPDVRERSYREGITVVNVGNSHTIAFLVFQERIFGIYEQHTHARTQEQLLYDLHEFKCGWLPDEQVKAEGGHGCALLELPREAEGFRPVYILGPQRHILAGCGQFVAPYGTMMTAGCFGLLHAAGLL